MTAKRLRELDQLARRHGFAPAEWTKRGHLRFRHRSGAIVVTSATPSDRRAWLNLLASFRRVAKGGVA